MEAIAKKKYVRMSPYKMRRVLNLIKDNTVNDAINQLHFTRKNAAQVIEKTLRSAVANLYQNDEAQQYTLNDIYVSRAFVDEGPALKRWRPMSKVVRPGRIRKRMSYLTIVVETR